MTSRVLRLKAQSPSQCYEIQCHFNVIALLLTPPGRLLHEDRWLQRLEKWWLMDWYSCCATEQYENGNGTDKKLNKQRRGRVTSLWLDRVSEFNVTKQLTGTSLWRPINDSPGRFGGSKHTSTCETEAAFMKVCVMLKANQNKVSRTRERSLFSATWVVLLQKMRAQLIRSVRCLWSSHWACTRCSIRRLQRVLRQLKERWESGKLWWCDGCTSTG